MTMLSKHAPATHVRTGIPFDMAAFHSSMAAIRDVCKTVLDAWKQDVMNLMGLCSNCVAPGFSTAMAENILNPEYEKITKHIVDQKEALQKAAKSSSLLADWRKMLAALNDDGFGAHFDHQFMKDVQTTVSETALYFEIGTAVQRILVELPAIRNKPQRAEQAKLWRKECSSHLPAVLKAKLSEIGEGKDEATESRQKREAEGKADGEPVAKSARA